MLREAGREQGCLEAQDRALVLFCAIALGCTFTGFTPALGEMDRRCTPSVRQIVGRCAA